MAWALVLVAVIAVGLPGAAWWLSRNLKPPAVPLGRPTPRSDPIDRWLLDHYQLGTVARALDLKVGRNSAAPRGGVTWPACSARKT